MTIEVALYGAGGFAREVGWLVDSCREAGESVAMVCYIDDNRDVQGTMLNGSPVMGLEDAYARYPQARVVGAVGDPSVREQLMVRAAAVGFGTYTLIHPRAERSSWLEIGEGTVICAGNILTTNIRLGKHVQLNLDCTVGHDAVLDDYTTLAPGVHVSGWVHMGKRVYVGTGANIINGTSGEPLTIGDGAVIGAGACVTKSVPAGVTAVGVPARVRG